MLRSSVLLAVAVISCGCAMRSSGSVGTASIESYVGQSRELAVRARTAPASGFAATVESHDPRLAAAFMQLIASPSAEAHRRVADRFRELRILDKAYDHYANARALDPHDVAAHEGLARIWRDWGFPHLGLADASRAVYYGPSSPSAHNTLGTILAALGRAAEARRSYERALALDPAAAYVLNNLCYLSFLEGRVDRAVSECEAALNLNPAMTAARNNLALAYAASSREDLARREFMAAGTRAAGLYNLGILYMAEKRYDSAVAAFEAAHRQRPSWAEAKRRATQARQFVATGPGPVAAPAIHP